MHIARFRRIAAIATTALSLVAATSYAQDTSVTNPPTTGTGATAGTVTPVDTMGPAMGMTDTPAATSGEDRDFPWGLLGLLGLLGLFRRGGATTQVSR
jgi:MYXO-CTERM domain-containing protein